MGILNCNLRLLAPPNPWVSGKFENISAGITVSAG